MDIIMDKQISYFQDYVTRKLFFFLDQYDFCVLEHKQLLLSPYYSLNAVVVPV